VSDCEHDWRVQPDEQWTQRKPNETSVFFPTLWMEERPIVCANCGRQDIERRPSPEVKRWPRADGSLVGDGIADDTQAVQSVIDMALGKRPKTHPPEPIPEADYHRGLATPLPRREPKRLSPFTETDP
jgi:hypothetical protein